MKKKILAVLAALVAVTGLVIGVQAPASAHFYTSDSAVLCGTGYDLIWTGPSGNDYLQVDVRRNGNSWCAVTRKLSGHGTATWMAAKIKPAGYPTYNNVDTGSYAHYAGPVYQGTSGCVDVSGASTYNGVTHWATPTVC